MLPVAGAEWIKSQIGVEIGKCAGNWMVGERKLEQCTKITSVSVHKRS